MFGFREVWAQSKSDDQMWRATPSIPPKKDNISGSQVTS